MGTRLYPETSPDIMEHLAGVPAGTWDRLSKYESINPERNSSEEDVWYDKLFQDHDLLALYNFKLFGWGKLTPEVSGYLKDHGHNTVCGQTQDPMQVKEILFRQGVSIESCIIHLSWS